MTTLRVADAWFGYAKESPVLRGVTLAVAPGEAVALVGPNGAGKTTLTRMMVALLHPTQGEVVVDGKPTRGLAPEDLADRTAYVFQHADQQLFAVSVEDEVAFGPRQLGRPDVEVLGDVASALEAVGLSRKRAVHPYDLPAAERKLVALAAALAQRPKLLVLDEPTQGLDRSGKLRVINAIRSLVQRGAAVVAVSHDLGFVAEALDRAVVLDNGAVTSDGPARNVIAGSRAVTARVSAALHLPGAPVKIAEVVQAIRELRLSPG